MSQLTTFSKEVKSWNETTKPLLENIAVAVGPDFIALYEKLTTNFEYGSNNLSDIMQKLYSKMNQIDPVTGEKRYGKLAEEKFHQSQQIFLETIGVLSNTLDSTKAKYDELKNIERIENERKLEEARKNLHANIVIPSALVNETSKPTISMEVDETPDQPELHHLHEKAEQLRQAKLQQREELKETYDFVSAS
jgi:hypothetical protein